MTGSSSKLLRRLMTAGWVLTVMLLAAGLVPSPAAATTDCHHDAAAHTATAQPDAGPAPVTVVAAVAQEPCDGSARHHEALPCCQGNGCVMMHSGLPVSALHPVPRLSGRTVPVSADYLADGLGHAPALPPPRSV